MPFLDMQNDMLPSDIPGSAGPATGLGENFDAAFLDQSYNNSQMGLEAALEESYVQNQKIFENITGEKGTAFPLPVYLYAARRASGENPAGFFQQSLTGESEDFHDPKQKKMLADFDALELKIGELKKQYPGVKNFSEILNEVQARAKDIEHNSASVAERGTMLGVTGSFAGRVAGSFTWRDPINIGTLGLGGIGKSMASRVLTEGAANAAVEAIDQFTGVQENRQLMGLEQVSPWQSIMYAGAGAALIRGGIEGAPSAYRALEAKISPERAMVRTFTDQINKSLAQPIDNLFARSGLSDDELARFLRERPDVDSRAAGYGLESEMEVRAANPYGDGVEADILHRERLRDAMAALDDRTGKDALLSSSAMIRALDTPEGTRFVIPENATITEPEAVVIAKSEDPELFRKLDEAQAKLSDATAQLTTAENNLRGRRVSDAVGLIDEPTGQRVRAIETELDETIPRARRQELERELDTLLANINPDEIDQAEKLFRGTTAKFDKRSFEASRRAARKDVNRLTKQAQDKVSKVAERQRLLRETSPLRQQSRVALRDLFGPTADEVSATVKAVDDFDAKRVDYAAAAVQRARKPVVAEGAKAGEPGQVDIGLDEMVPENFAIPVETLANGDVRYVTVREILDDLADDDNLAKAMKECAI
jgi:hypothetical protein